MDGTADDLKGRAKEAAGALTDDDDLKAAEGKTDQAAGKAKDVLDDVKDKAEDAVDKSRTSSTRLTGRVPNRDRPLAPESGARGRSRLDLVTTRCARGHRWRAPLPCVALTSPELRHAHLETQLPTGVTAGRHARAFVHDILHQSELDQLNDVVELLSTELVNNVVEHAAGARRSASRPMPRRCEWRSTTRVPKPPCSRCPTWARSTAGSLLLIAAIADDWGFEVGSRGKTVCSRSGRRWRPDEPDGRRTAVYRTAARPAPAGVALSVGLIGARDLVDEQARGARADEAVTVEQIGTCVVLSRRGRTRRASRRPSTPRAVLGEGDREIGVDRRPPGEIEVVARVRGEVGRPPTRRTVGDGHRSGDHRLRRAVPLVAGSASCPLRASAWRRMNQLRSFGRPRGGAIRSEPRRCDRGESGGRSGASGPVPSRNRNAVARATSTPSGSCTVATTTCRRLPSGGARSRPAPRADPGARGGACRW